MHAHAPPTSRLKGSRSCHPTCGAAGPANKHHSHTDEPEIAATIGNGYSAQPILPRMSKPVRHCFYVVFFLVALPIGATAQTRHTAQSLPLSAPAPVVRSQPLANGEVTHQVQVRTAPGEAAVTVRSIQPSSVTGNYRLSFAQLDTDGDGYLSREEASANPALADEFTALDTARQGRLGRAQLAGWLID